MILPAGSLAPQYSCLLSFLRFSIDDNHIASSRLLIIYIRKLTRAELMSPPAQAQQIFRLRLEYCHLSSATYNRSLLARLAWRLQAWSASSRLKSIRYVLDEYPFDRFLSVMCKKIPVTVFVHSLEYSQTHLRYSR